MVRIIKKNDESSMEYQLGDVLEVDSTWYGGVTVKSNSGILVPLDKDEYESVEEKEEKIEQTTEQLPIEQRDLVVGDIVRHFKREWVSETTSEYLYKILAFASHTETGERLVIYQGLYPPFKICARPYDMFMSKVDKKKYPNSKQQYRFEKFNE
ncbi:MAG: DUF1653 domain-containing protein [Lachnospiraceae bacterium]|jgi:hypothetical protein|nr:DUF1653 domain-containing protein [Lachnospiraceae bacterium]